MTEIKRDDTRNILSDIKLFEGLSSAQLDWVAKHAHRRIFTAGTNVLTIEQPGEAVFIILHGTVKIHIEQGERDVIISVLGSGDILGEMSLIDSVGRSASAITLENSLMLWMDGGQWRVHAGWGWMEGGVFEGKKVRIRVRTVNCTYVGDFLIPPMRNRVSDAINEEQRLFISLTDVLINDKDRSDFVAINKNLIESIAQL